MRRPESGVAIQNPAEDRESRRVIVSGGTEGIGRAITEEMIAGENRVAILARTRSKLQDIQGNRPDVIAEQVDLSDRKSAKEFVARAAEALGGIDVLILNAAVSGIPHVPETPEESLARREDVFRVNEVAQVALSRAAIESLRQSHGALVFVTSGIARMENPPSGTEDYANSKKRIERFLRVFSERPGNEGVAMFCVNPGPTDTRMHQEIIDHGPGAVAAKSRELRERGALRDPDIIGRIISKIALTRRQFNPETKKYDLQIANASVVDISQENIDYELALSGRNTP